MSPALESKWVYTRLAARDCPPESTKPINIRLSEEMANFAQMPANTDYKKAIEMLEAGPAGK